MTPYAYVVPPGDQIWLNYVNLFVDTIKLDGRLMKYARSTSSTRSSRRNGLAPRRAGGVQ